MCQGPPPCCIPPQQEFTCVGLRLGGQAPPSMASSQALGSGTQSRTLPAGYGEKSFVTPVFTQPCAHTNGHIFYLSNTWYGHYDCHMFFLTFLEVQPLPLLCRRCKVPVWESAFLSRGTRMSQWPWHSILTLTMFNCVSTAFYKVNQIVETIPQLKVHMFIYPLTI